MISPLLANIYLHRLDRAWMQAGEGVLVRYADDLVVLCRTEREATRALAALTALLAELGLEPKGSKTRIVHLEEGGAGIDFLGFHHRWVRAESAQYRHIRFLARWPAKKAVQQIRGRIRAVTDRTRLRVPVEVLVAEINQLLRGWTAYFRYGNSARQFDQLRDYARMRLALVMAKRHRRSRAYGWSVVAFQSPDQLGLISLDGIVVAPRPHRDWRGKPNAGGEQRR